MENVVTLMIFPQGQTQALVLQYKTVESARKARDTLSGAGLDKVMVRDDYSRELTARPCEIQLALLQDIDQVTEGNVLAQVKNNIVQMLSQMRTTDEIEKDPKIKAAQVRAQLSQGLNQAGAFRA